MAREKGLLQIFCFCNSPFSYNNLKYLYTVGRLSPQTLANSLTFIIPEANAG